MEGQRIVTASSIMTKKDARGLKGISKVGMMEDSPSLELNSSIKGESNKKADS